MVKYFQRFTSPCDKRNEFGFLIVGARMLRLFAALILLLPPAYASESKPDASPLKLAVVPNGSHAKLGLSIDACQPFYVVATNPSAAPVLVWKEWCSWGYYALTFEVQTADGATAWIKKQSRGWDRNFPDSYIIAPDQHFIIAVDLKEQWDGVPTVQQKLRIRAHYSIQPEAPLTSMVLGIPPQSGLRESTTASPWIEAQWYP